MIKLIIFDYDGVIVDSFPVVHQVYQIICKKLNKNCPTNFEDFKKVYGISSKEFKKNTQLNENESLEFDRIYKQEIIKQKAVFFQGIKEVIENISKDYKIVIISSNLKEEVSLKIKELGVGQHISKIIGGQLGPLDKSQAIQTTLKEEKLKAEEVVLIGDRVNDYYDAKEAGLHNVILVDYGWGYDLSKIPEYKQKAIVKTPHDILEAVKKF